MNQGFHLFASQRQASNYAEKCKRQGHIAVVVERPNGFIVRWAGNDWTPPSSLGNGPEQERDAPKTIRGRWHDRGQHCGWIRE
jgi:hypothetical protein